MHLNVNTPYMGVFLVYAFVWAWCWAVIAITLGPHHRDRTTPRINGKWIYAGCHVLKILCGYLQFDAEEGPTSSVICSGMLVYTWYCWRPISMS